MHVSSFFWIHDPQDQLSISCELLTSLHQCLNFSMAVPTTSLLLSLSACLAVSSSFLSLPLFLTLIILSLHRSLLLHVHLIYHFKLYNLILRLCTYTPFFAQQKCHQIPQVRPKPNREEEDLDFSLQIERTKMVAVVTYLGPRGSRDGLNLHQPHRHPAQPKVCMVCYEIRNNIVAKNTFFEKFYL